MSWIALNQDDLKALKSKTLYGSIVDGERMKIGIGPHPRLVNDHRIIEVSANTC